MVDNETQYPAPLERSTSLQLPAPAAGTLLRSKSAQYGASKRGSPMNMNTPEGFCIPCTVPVEVRELQCRVCDKLVESPYHAPCGHSFCQSHLNLNSETDELGEAADLLRRLCVEQGLAWTRAREALALSPRDVKRAEELCIQASGIEGRAVRVRPDVQEPHFGWGAVKASNVGRVARSEDGHAHVDFPQQNRWHCLVEEIEVDEVADQVKVGAFVRVRQGIQPVMGWGTLEGDKIGRVVMVAQARAIVQGDCNMWFGFVGELEPVPPTDDTKDAGSDAGVGSVATLPSLVAAVARLRANTPSEACLASLGSILKKAAESTGKLYCMTLRGELRTAIMQSHGAMDLLRIAGFEAKKWDAFRTRVFIESTIDDLPIKAKAVLDALEAEFGTMPTKDFSEDYKRFTVAMTIDKAKVRGEDAWDTYWKDTLQPALTASLRPPGTGWTWGCKGWENEDELKQHIQGGMFKGPVSVARGQSKKDSRQIQCSLEALGFKVDVTETEAVADSEFFALGDDPNELSANSSWEGPVKYGARVRIVNLEADKLPKDVTPQSIGVVSAQYQHSKNGLQLLVSFPGSINQHLDAGCVEVVDDAELIQPGTRVKVRKGVEPHFGWQGVESSDIGVVHAVQFDGTVLVYLPWIQSPFRATLYDLDTKDLPQIAQGNCPVCHEPLLAGEHLAIDMVLEAQRQRLQRLMSGERAKTNNVLGGSTAPAQPKLVRTNTHKGEMTCSICLDLMVAPVTLGCGHSFCKAHIEAWLLENPRCPNCKHRVLPERVNRRQRPTHRQCLFDVELRDDEQQAGGEAAAAPEALAGEWPDVPINSMLEKQLVRHFKKDLDERKSEMASEVWEGLQSRSRGYLARLRAFVRQFDAEAVEKLVAEGYTDVDMELPGTHGGTLLMLAAEQGLAASVKGLLERRADPIRVATSIEDVGATALSLAAAQGHAETVQILLDAGEWAAVRQADALASAVEQGCVECVTTLMKHQEGLASFQNSFGFPAILTAVQTNRAEVIPTLLSHGADLESSLSTGWLASGARFTAANGVYQAVGEFNGKTYYQNTKGAVMFFNEWWKISEQRRDMGRSHLYSMPEPRRDTPEPPTGTWTTHGSDTSKTFGTSPPSLEKLDPEQGAALTPLVLAVQLGSLEATTQLLELGADPCTVVPKTGESVLQIACSGGDLSMVRTLMESRASPETADKVGRMPLHSACQAGHHLIAKELLSSAAAPNSEGLPTPLMLAVCCGKYPPRAGKSPLPALVQKYELVVTELLAARAEVSRSDTEGSSVLHLAARSGASEDVLNALVTAGALPEAIDADGRTPFFSALLSGRNAAACALAQHCGKWEESLSTEYKNLLPLSAAALLGDLPLVNRLLKMFQDAGDISKWLQSAQEWHKDLPDKCVRLTFACEGAEKNCWQVIHEPRLPYSPKEEGAAEEVLEVGDHVVLGSDYTSQGHAARGPLKPGDVGRIIKKDKGTVPLQVEAGRHTFWYREGALTKHQVFATEKIVDWKGHLSHPFVGGGGTITVQLQLKSETTGQLSMLEQSKDFTLERTGDEIKICEEGGTLQLLGKMDDRGCIQGKVVKDGFRSSLPERGNFVLIPVAQDATVRCPRGHACERMSPLTWRPCTCDVCSKPIKMKEPFSFCCRECNYDVCKSCCGASLLARLPPEQHMNLGSLTPLHVGAATGHGDIVQALLDANADPFAKDSQGRTCLHWAAACGHGWVIEVLLNHGGPPESLTSAEDIYGHAAFALTAEELLRFCPEDCKGSLHGTFIEVGRVALGVPGEPGVSGIYRSEGKRNERPIYVAKQGPGWAIYWDNQALRWGLYRERYDAACIQYQSKVDSKTCPTTGWEPVVASEPVPTFEEVLPWRAGQHLLEATPPNYRPKNFRIKELVNSLPALATNHTEYKLNLAPGVSTTITLPAGAPSLEWLIQEMIRRGDLPSEPPAGCITQ